MTGSVEQRCRWRVQSGAIDAAHVQNEALRQRLYASDKQDQVSECVQRMLCGNECRKA